MKVYTEPDEKAREPTVENPEPPDTLLYCVFLRVPGKTALKLGECAKLLGGRSDRTDVGFLLEQLLGQPEILEQCADAALSVLKRTRGRLRRGKK